MKFLIKYHRNRTDFNRNELFIVVNGDTDERVEREFIRKYSDAIIHSIDEV